MRPAQQLATRGSTRDLAAVAGLFVANGLAVGVFGGSLPGLRAYHSLQSVQVVGILVSAAICAVLSMNISGPLADRVGARAPSLLGGAGMAVGTAVLGGAPNYATLIVGAAVFGLGNGAMDVAMNALGVQVEAARRKPIMSRFHAFFSVSLMSSQSILAQSWFSTLGRTWGKNLQDDQYLGASLGWALGDYPLASSWRRLDALLDLAAGEGSAGGTYDAS